MKFSNIAYKLFSGEKSEKRLKITLIVVSVLYFTIMILQLIF